MRWSKRMSLTTCKYLKIKYTCLIYYNSQMQKLIEKVATCVIFWAADFKDFTSASTECYSEVQNISNCYDSTCSKYNSDCQELWYVIIIPKK